MTSAQLATNLARFAEMEGRHPRLLLATASSDEQAHHKQVATLFADGGFDVDVAPQHSDAQSIALQAIECDADSSDPDVADIKGSRKCCRSDFGT